MDGLMDGNKVARLNHGFCSLDFDVLVILVGD